jgi:hypothetical protein
MGPLEYDAIMKSMLHHVRKHDKDTIVAHITATTGHILPDPFILSYLHVPHK